MTLPLGLAFLFFPEALQTCISASAKRELPWPITEPREQRAGGREGDSHRNACVASIRVSLSACVLMQYMVLQSILNGKKSGLKLER